MSERNRTGPFLIRYALYLYFLGLSLRSTSKALKPFVDRSYVAIWYWIQEFNPKDVFRNKKKSRIVTFIIDETIVQIDGKDYYWLWIALHMNLICICVFDDSYISREKELCWHVINSSRRITEEIWQKNHIH